jgi:hypothetical protein
VAPGRSLFVRLSESETVCDLTPQPAPHLPDLHSLFDVGHLRIDPATLTAVLSPALAATCYRDLAGRRFVCPRMQTTGRTGKPFCSAGRLSKGVTRIGALPAMEDRSEGCSSVGPAGSKAGPHTPRDQTPARLELLPDLEP